MSGIYGLIRFDGSVAMESLVSMGDAMAYYGPDGGGVWLEGGVGLGHLLLQVAPEDSFEDQPLRDGSTTLVTFARLTNREDLLKAFGVPPEEYRTTPDGSLVMRAFSRWGNQCPDHLDGDWQLAAWDSQSKQLFIARDHFGSTGLYYYRGKNFFAFASNIRALLALPEVPRRPDMLKMAQVLTAWLGEGWRTAYENLYRLPPAHMLRVSSDTIETKRYWFPEQLPELRYSRDEDYVEEFLNVFGQAVRSRLHSGRPVAALLSGGLDSGAVVATAAPLLAAEQKRLTAFTSIPLFSLEKLGVSRTGNEWGLAAATAHMTGDNIDHVALDSANACPLFAIERRLEIHNEPGHSASNHYWLEDAQTQAALRGAGVLLTGQFGNFSISYNGYGSFWHALPRGGFRSAVNVVRYCEANVWHTLKRQILRPLVLPALRFVKQNVGGSPWENYSAIRPAFAEAVQLLEQMQNSGHDPTFTLNTSRHAQQAVFLDSSIGARWHEVGAAHGMEVRDPTTDRRVIEFCLRVPEEQYRRQGESRWLIRRAMNGRLPQEVLANNRRGLQAADLAQRVMARRREMSACLDRFAASERVRNVLDLERMREVLSMSDLKGELALVNFACSCILLRGIGVGLFLESV